MSDYSELLELAQDAGLVDWKWWTSNSVLRLTTEREGRHGADGDAISAYRDSVQCPEAYRAFIEKASPAAIGELIAENDRLAEEYDKAWRHDLNDKNNVQVLMAEVVRLNAEIERLRTAEGDAMTCKAGMENVAQQRDQLFGETEQLKAEAKENEMHMRAFGEVMRSQEAQIDQLKAENKARHGQVDTLTEWYANALNEIEAMRKDAELGRVAIRYIDRLCDPAECDPLETIVEEYVTAFSAVMSKQAARQ